jgi:sarcosine oxidase subunit beta
LAPGLNADDVIGATFCGRDGIADPNGVTMGFAKAAQAAGAAIERDTEATGIRVIAGRVAAVETSRGTIETRAVVNAAGPHARQIGAMVGVDVPVDPYRRHIFIAQAPSTNDEPRTTNERRTSNERRTTNDEPRTSWNIPPTRIMVIDFESTFYFHREGAALLFGMADKDEPSGFDTTVRWDFLPRVIDVAVKRLPALADASVSHAWAGLYEMSPDGNPIIGPAPNVGGLYLINGFSGHGFQHSPAAGRILADLIVGRDAGIDVTPFALERFTQQGVTGERYVV